MLTPSGLRIVRYPILPSIHPRTEFYSTSIEQPIDRAQSTVNTWNNISARNATDEYHLSTSKLRNWYTLGISKNIRN